MDAAFEAAEPDERQRADGPVGEAPGVPGPAPLAQPPGPAHTRSGLVQWAATAGAVGAVIAAAVVAAPAQGVPRAAAQLPAAAPKPVPAAAAPDPANVRLPLDCGHFPVKVSLRFSAELAGDGIAETVVAAHCGGGNGTPPDGVFILAPGRPTTGPVIAQTLVQPGEDLSLVKLGLRSDGTITARARGYSAGTVPRCCPDLDLNLSWARQGPRYTRSTQQAVPAAQA